MLEINLIFISSYTKADIVSYYGLYRFPYLTFYLCSCRLRARTASLYVNHAIINPITGIETPIPIPIFSARLSPSFFSSEAGGTVLCEGDDRGFSVVETGVLVVDEEPLAFEGDEEDGDELHSQARC